MVVNKNPIKRKEESEKKYKERVLKRNQAEKKYKINGRLKKIIQELRNNSHKRTEELKYLQTGEFYSLPVLKEISKRLDLTFKQLIYLTSDEIVEFLIKKKTINRKLIKQRQKEYALLMKGRKRWVFAGKEINKIREEQKIANNLNEIRGTIASKGFAKGIVKIITDTSQLNKVKSGDILVALMTTPDYVLAMRKSAAIITNDGGITCHATIISRELGIPCIIGTKIATKVLKDGDLVEVDAERGIVKILKKAV